MSLRLEPNACDIDSSYGSVSHKDGRGGGCRAVQCSTGVAIAA